MLGEVFYSCSALLASRMELQWVSYFAAAPLEPFLTSIWSGSARRAFTPNPLSYFPQISMSTTTQFMVSLVAFLPLLQEKFRHPLQCSSASSNHNACIVTPADWMQVQRHNCSVTWHSSFGLSEHVLLSHL